MSGAGSACMAPLLVVLVLGKLITTHSALLAVADSHLDTSTQSARRKDGPRRPLSPLARTALEMQSSKRNNDRKISWTRRI